MPSEKVKKNRMTAFKIKNISSKGKNPIKNPLKNFTVSPKYIEHLRFPGFPINFPLKGPFWDSYNPFYLFPYIPSFKDSAQDSFRGFNMEPLPVSVEKNVRPSKNR